MELKDYAQPCVKDVRLESLQGMIIELGWVVSQTQNLLFSSRIKDVRTLTDRIADEVSQTARKVKSECEISHDLSRLLEVVARAFEPKNRPKVYDYDVLNYLCGFTSPFQIAHTGPIDVYTLIALLSQKEIEAHYSGCSCPLFLSH